MDLKQIMEMAGQLKERVDSAQAEAKTLSVTGEAGAGLVSASMNGQHELTALKIDRQLVEGGDVGMIEDLVRAAVNQAGGKVAAMLKERMGGFAQQFGINIDDPGAAP